MKISLDSWEANNNDKTKVLKQMTIIDYFGSEKVFKQKTITKYLGSSKSPNDEKVKDTIQRKQQKEENQGITLPEASNANSMKDSCTGVVMSKDKGVKRKRCLIEHSWEERHAIIFFHYHPLLGNKRNDVTSQVYNLSPSTLKGWLSKSDFRRKWLESVKAMKLSDIWDLIPNDFKECHGHQLKQPDNFNSKIPVNSLPKGAVNTSSSSSKMVLSHQIDSFQQEHVVVMKHGGGRGADVTFVTKPRYRIVTSSGVSKKYPEESAWVKEQLEIAWYHGIPIRTEELMDMVREKFQSGRLFETFLSYPTTDRKRKSALQWLRREMKSAGFVQGEPLLVPTIYAD